VRRGKAAGLREVAANDLCGDESCERSVLRRRNRPRALEMRNCRLRLACREMREADQIGKAVLLEMCLVALGRERAT
jgi:hypothetical protein